MYNCIVAIPKRPPCKALLTAEHSASSYGIPVVVVKGTAYGPGEVFWIDGSPEIRAQAAQAGYKVLSDQDSRWDDYAPAVNINLRLPRDLHEALRRTSFEIRESITGIIVRNLQNSPEIQTRMDGGKALARSMSPGQAWDAYVGSQSPAEFWRISQEQGHATLEDACRAYAQDLPNMMSDWTEQYPVPDLDSVAELLAKHLRANI